MIGTGRALTPSAAAQSGVPTPAEPDTVAGLNLWLEDLYTGSLFQDDELTTPAASGDPVGGWVDQSAGGFDAFTASYRPTYTLGTGLVFDTADTERLGFASNLNVNSTGGTFYFVGYYPNAAFRSYFLSASGNGHLWALQNLAGDADVVFRFTNSVGTNYSINVSKPAGAGLYCVRFRLYYTGSDYRCAVKAFGQTEVVSGTAVTGSFNARTVNNIGTYAQTLRALYAWNATALSEGDRTTVEDWIDYRYGVRP